MSLLKLVTIIDKNEMDLKIVKFLTKNKFDTQFDTFVTHIRIEVVTFQANIPLKKNFGKI